MPVVNCPGCGRDIPLEDHELVLRIECARCDTRFYPMIRAAAAPAPATPEPAPVAPTPTPEPVLSQPTEEGFEDAWRREGNRRDRPRRNRRPRKKRNSLVPLIVGLTLGLVVLLTSGTVFVLLLTWEKPRSSPTRAETDGMASQPATVPRPPPRVPPQPLPHVPPGEAVPVEPVPPQPRPSGPSADLGGNLAPIVPGRSPVP
jgi:hypothetical protein